MSTLSYVHLDTTRLSFEDIDGDPGSKRQLLYQDVEGGGTIEISYVPPGFSPNVMDVLSEGTHRHYHRSVNERHYVLSGDYPVWHWENLADDGKLTILRRHSYLENPPFTVHGVKPEIRPETGTQLLVWNNGRGTGIFEPEAADETVTIANDLLALDMAVASPRLVMTQTVPWLRHPTMPSWKIKLVAPEANGSPAVHLVHVPADTQGDVGVVSGNAQRWLFVLSGDLKVDLFTLTGAKQIALCEGHFLSWGPSDRLGLTSGVCSDGSCTVLCVGHDLAMSK